MAPVKPYALLIASWVATMTHAERERPTLLTDVGRAIIRTALAQVKAEDGDPATWTDCEHCDGTGEWSDPATERRGLCFQCRGKGRQSDADRRRNWGHATYRRASEAS